MRYIPLPGLALVVALSACASAPPKAPAAPAITADQKMSWMLRLENERILRAPAPPPAPAVTPPAKPKKNAPLPVVIPVPDLATLLGDMDPRIRRRAALAVGRVG